MYYSVNLNGDECSSMRDDLNQAQSIDRESIDVDDCASVVERPAESDRSGSCNGS